MISSFFLRFFTAILSVSVSVCLTVCLSDYLFVRSSLTSVIFQSTQFCNCSCIYSKWDLARISNPSQKFSIFFSLLTSLCLTSDFDLYVNDKMRSQLQYMLCMVVPECAEKKSAQGLLHN